MSTFSSDFAYDFIRKRILNGDYRPGQSLMTKVLAKETGLSRTPIRDALRQLESDGLVTIRARLGASVTAMNLEEYSELCGLRIALESYAAGLAAEHRTEAALHEMRASLDTMRTLTEKFIAATKDAPALADIARADVKFHLAVVTASKNRLIKQEILRLQLLNRVVLGPQTEAGGAKTEKPQTREEFESVLVSHEKIYRAIEAGDEPAAKLAMEQHIKEGIDRNLRRMAQQTGVTREFSEEELSYLS